MICRHKLALLLSAALVACGPKSPPQSSGDASAESAPGTSAEGDGVAPAPVWDERRRDETFNGALSLLETGKAEDARQALELLREVGEQEPDLAQVPHNQGVAWLTIGDLEQAKKRFLRATELRPELAESWQNLGALAEERGDIDRALQHYRSGLRYAEGNAALLAAEIGALRRLGQYDAATRKAKAAIQADSNNVGAYNQLGLVYLETGKVELAQFIYNRAMQIVVAARTDPYMHANLGRVYWEQDLKANALDEFQKALEIEPNLLLARLYMAEMAIDNRDFESVVATLEPALAYAADDAAVHVNLGIGYRGTGRLEESKKSYEKALELNPSDPSPYLNLAVLIGDYFKDYEQALGLLDTYQRQGGQSAETVEAWKKDFEKQKRRLEMEAKRRKRREDAAKRRKDAAEAEKRVQEEKERREREEAQKAAAAASPPASGDQEGAPEGSQPAGANAATPSGVAPGGTSAAVGASASQGSGTAPEVSNDSAGSGAPSGGAGSAPPRTEPPTEGVDAGTTSPSAASGTGEGTTAGAAPVPPPAPSAASAGATCAAVGSCGTGFECANDGVCREASTPGTFGVGIGCFQDVDCAYGLVCASNKCSAPSSGDGAGSPWGQ